MKRQSGPHSSARAAETRFATAVGDTIRTTADVLQFPTITPLARLLLSRVPPGQACPRYGTAEWDALPEQDPRRAAPIMRAAEAWRRHCSPAQVAADLLAEMVGRDDDLNRRLRETSWDVHAALYPQAWDVNTTHRTKRVIGEIEDPIHMCSGTPPYTIRPTLTETQRLRTDYDGGTWAKDRRKRGAA